MEASVKNVADEGQVKESKSREKRLREREIEDVRSIISTAIGRRFVWRYLEKCGVFHLSFNHSGSITAFNEGARDIGLKILADITDANPDALIQMMKENKENSNV